MRQKIKQKKIEIINEVQTWKTLEMELNGKMSTKKKRKNKKKKSNYKK